MIISELCFLFQGDSFVFPVTQDIKGVTGPKGPDGGKVSYCHTFREEQ